jgi:hypothetical protein
LLVIVAALVWIPVSFIAATAVHAWLIADAGSLPKWMQIFHAVAAILAKSKLLMLPAYPAAWPQAKRHPIVQALARVWRFVASLHFVRKTRFRFGQVEGAMDRTAAAMGFVRAWNAALAAIDRALARVGDGIRAVLGPVMRWLAKLPIMGSVVRTYASHYDRAGERPPQRLSDKVRAFFQRWQIKFTPGYYEAKETEGAAKGHGAHAPPSTERSSAP